MNTNEQQLTLALQDKDEAQRRYEAAFAKHDAAFAERRAAFAERGAAVTKYDTAAAKYEANEDDKKEHKLKELKDEAFANVQAARAIMESADANLQSADANLQSANEQITLTLQRLPTVVLKKRKAEADSYEERGIKIPSVLTHRAKELLAMIRTLRPGGGVEVHNVKGETPQAAADDDDKETAAGNATLDYLELPKGVQFLTTKGKFGRRLLVRPFYPVIFDHWWKRANEGTTEAGQDLTGEILIGTPGIGKSMFLLYALYRLAQMDWSGAILLQDTSGEMALFEGDTLSLDQSVAKTALQNPSTVYLCDGSNKGDLKSCDGPYFLAASPNVDVWKRVADKEQCRGPLVAPVCTLGEMLAFRKVCFPKVSLDAASEAYAIGGGVPRLLKRLAADESYDVKQAIKSSIGSTDIEACRTAIEYGQSKDGKEAHNLFHLSPCEHDPLSTTERTLKFGTPFIEHSAVEHMLKVGRERVASFLINSESLPAFPTLRGALYEGFAIRRLEEGGEFRCCKLLKPDFTNPNQRTREQEIVMNVPRSTETAFRRLAELGSFEEERLYRPMHNTLETVDSFVSRKWLFQITVSKKHDVKVSGLNKVLKRLTEIGDTTEIPRLFFVVPKSVYEEGYECAQALKKNEGTCALRAGEAERAEQYVMCVPL